MNLNNIHSKDMDVIGTEVLGLIPGDEVKRCEETNVFVKSSFALLQFHSYTAYKTLRISHLIVTG